MINDPFFAARMQIDDGLGLRNPRARPLGVPGMQPPMQPPMQQPMQQPMQPPMQQPQMGPGMLNINGATSPLLQLAQLGARYNVPSYTPGPAMPQGVYDPRAARPFQEGGLATSLPGEYETRNNDMDFMHDRYAQMHEVAGKYHAARGGFAVR